MQTDGGGTGCTTFCRFLACAFLAWPSLLPSLLMVVIVGVLWGRGAIYIMYYERISLKIRADVILSRT